MSEGPQSGPNLRNSDNSAYNSKLHIMARTFEWFGGSTLFWLPYLPIQPTPTSNISHLSVFFVGNEQQETETGTPNFPDPRSKYGGSSAAIMSLRHCWYLFVQTYLVQETKPLGINTGSCSGCKVVDPNAWTSTRARHICCFVFVKYFGLFGTCPAHYGSEPRKPCQSMSFVK